MGSLVPFANVHEIVQYPRPSASVVVGKLDRKIYILMHSWDIQRESLDISSYHLVMTNIAMVKPWPIEIDGLPSYKMVIFHGYVK